MFYPSGTAIKIKIFKDGNGWRFRIEQQSMSSPVSYLGNLETENLTGDVFLHDDDVIVVNTNMSVSDAKNEILAGRPRRDDITLNGKVIGSLDLKHIYNQIEEKFILEANKKAESKLNLKLDYAKKYKEEVNKNKKLAALIKKYIKTQSDISNLIKEFNII